MKNTKLVLLVLTILLGVSLSCKFLKEKTSKAVSDAPKIDFTTPAAGLDVKVHLDKKQTACGKVGKNGGTVSLTGTGGSKFTLDVPADALDAETTITMTAVASLDGAPRDKNTPTAVQLEPSGLFFKEFATLTILPAKEIPIKEQIIFGYEGDGKDYHLALIDHKSKDIKIKLMHFSGAAVGSGSDSAWAANLQIQAETSRTRLEQKMASLAQAESQRQLLGDESGSEEFSQNMKSLLEQFEDQVVLKERAAGELDCQFARKAIEDIIMLERLRQLLGFEPATDTWEKVEKLAKIATECKKSYRVNGSSNGASFSGEICGLDKPFVLNVEAITGSWPMKFTPDSATSGQMEGTFSAGDFTQTGGGPYTITLNEDGSGTIQFTYNATATSPAGSRTSSATSKLPLKPASDVSCS